MHDPLLKQHAWGVGGTVVRMANTSPLVELVPRSKMYMLPSLSSAKPEIRAIPPTSGENAEGWLLNDPPSGLMLQIWFEA